MFKDVCFKRSISFSQNLRQMKLVASAPGKVIICGEHAVVYGRLALACSISLKTEVMMHVEEKSADDVESYSLLLTVNALDNFKLTLRSNDCEKLFALDTDFSTENVSNDFERIGAEFADLLSLFTGASKTCSMIFLYLIKGILLNSDSIPTNSRIRFDVTGDLPLSSGLGSSAALAASLAAVLVAYKLGATRIDDEIRLAADKWAFNTEQFAHGKASGLDNFTIVHGGLIEAQNGSFVKRWLPDVMTNNYSVILVDSNVPKSTRTTVASVKQLVEEFPLLCHRLFDAIEGVSIETKRLFSNEGSVNAEAIMKLLKVNHCLLKSLGVSHEVLDEIVTICEQYGLGAKLTGGGGGGMVLLLIESQNTPDRLDSLLSRLSMRGFRTFVTKLTNQGLDMK